MVHGEPVLLPHSVADHGDRPPDGAEPADGDGACSALSPTAAAARRPPPAQQLTVPAPVSAQQPAPAADLEAGPPAGGNFMQDFFNQVAAVKRDMETVNGNIKELEEKQNKAITDVYGGKGALRSRKC